MRALARSVRVSWLVAACALWCLAGSATACDRLTVEKGWIREPPPGSTTVAAFMSLRNRGHLPLLIESFSSLRFAMTMLHVTEQDGDKVTMRHLESLALAPGETAELKPGGLHLMLMNPTRPVRDGDVVTLDFGCNGQVTTVALPVRQTAP